MNRIDLGRSISQIILILFIKIQPICLNALGYRRLLALSIFLMHIICIPMSKIADFLLH